MTFGSKTAITWTLTSLAASTTAGRQSALLDFNSLGGDDAQINVTVKTSSSALSGTKCCYIYAVGGDGTTLEGSSTEAFGSSDAARTLDATTNVRLLAIINCPATSTTYDRMIPSLRMALGGVIPRNLVLFLTNDTGQTLDASVGGATYQIITY